MILIVPLGNIKCNPPISLSEDTTIEKIEDKFSPVIQDALSKNIIRHQVPFKYCLIVRNPKYLNDVKIIKKQIEDTILVFRLFKEGDIFFNYICIDEKNWYDRSDVPDLKAKHVGVFFYMGWHHKGLSTTYIIESFETENLKQFFKNKISNRLLDHRSFRYFFKGFHEPYSEDRFLSNAIALENILVNDTKDQSNIRYKFIDRGCYLLHISTPGSNDANVYAKSLRCIYDLRCKIVHSSKNDINWGDNQTQKTLYNSENYLRIFLNMILKNKRLIKSSEIDIEKRKLYLKTSNESVSHLTP